MNRASPFQPGVVIDGFTLIRELGRGGMGSVWEVERAGARYALKTAMVGGDAELALRFQREAEAQARVDGHPNVVRVHTAGSWSGLPYLIMDLAPGGDLETRLHGGPLPWREAARLVADLARGLAHVHAQGVLHRDLKPANVLFDERGTPQLVDFGVAKLQDARSLTETGALMGTPAYMAPEQASGERVDARADVYGLGAILYHCLSEAPPFTGNSAIAVLERVLTAQPEPLPSSLPTELRELCLQALAKQPAERPSLVELGARLELLLEGASGGRGIGLLPAGAVAGIAALLGVGLGAALRGPPAPAQAPVQSPVLAELPASPQPSASSPAGALLPADALGLAKRLVAEAGELPAGGARLRAWIARILLAWQVAPQAVCELRATTFVDAAQLLHKSAGPEPGLEEVRLQRDLLLIARYLGPTNSPLGAERLAALRKLAEARPELLAGLYPLAARYGPGWPERFRILEEDPHRCPALDRLAKLQPLVDRQVLLESAALHYPGSAAAWRLLGDALRERGQYELAFYTSQHAQRLHPSPLNGVNLGLALQARGESERAAALFNDALLVERSMFTPYAAYAKALQARDAGNYQRAAELLEEARTLQQQIVQEGKKKHPDWKQIPVWRATAKLRFWALYRETMLMLQDQRGIKKAEERLSAVREF